MVEDIGAGRRAYYKVMALIELAEDDEEQGERFGQGRYSPLMAPARGALEQWRREWPETLATMLREQAEEKARKARELAAGFIARKLD